MKKYIDTDMVLNIIREFFWKKIDAIPTKRTEDGEVLNLKIINPFLEDNKALCSAIKAFPTADVRENVRGEWIDKALYKQTTARTFDGYTFCNKCNHHEEYGYRSDFCPCCGADMSGGKNDTSKIL